MQQLEWCLCLTCDVSKQSGMLSVLAYAPAGIVSGPHHRGDDLKKLLCAP